MDASVISLLEKYRLAFDAADAEAIADCYFEPCVTIRGDGSFHLLRNREEIVELFGAVAKQYHDEGMHHGVYSDLEIQMIGTKCALATMEWKIIGSDGATIRNWRNSYNVMEQDGTCVFYVSTFHI